MGLIAPSHQLGLTSSPTLQYADHLCPGAIAFVSQSGALMGTLFVLGYDHGVGFSFLVSVGNQADLDLCDFLEAGVEDPETKVICLYVEEVADPARFVALARRASAAGKPVLAVKAGRTEAGRTMARSHTASLAGSYETFDAVCRACGVTLMDEPEGMLMTASLLARNPSPRGDGLGVVVSSGGGGAILADRLTQAGATLVAWNETTSDRLGKHFLPQHRNNPIDLGAHVGVLGPHVFHDTIRAVYEDPQVGVFVYLLTPQPLMPETLDVLLEIWRDGRKPVFVVLDTSRFAEDLRRRMLDAGMPFVTDIDDVLRAIAVVRQRLAMGAPESAPDRPVGLPAAPLVRDGFLTEPETKALLSAYGITVSEDRIVATRQQAVAAAQQITFPVVLKAVSRRIVHKSDGGFVHLKLEGERAVAAAFDAIAAAWPDGDEPLAVSVQPMVQGDIELIVGARRDPQFGPLVLVGLGGVFVEVLQDVQMWPAPLNAATALAMLHRLKAWPLLAGARGRAPLDVEAVADAVARLSWLAHDLGPRLIDIEINPLIVRKAGLGAVAVDGRANMGQPHE
jgi:acetyl-CoA synthetase (ADP-forming)